MNLLKVFLVLLLGANTLMGYTLYDNIVEDKIWKRGATFLGFLEENSLPLDLYYNLDNDDEKIISDIRSNTIYQVLKDEHYDIKQVLIPLNEELQIHIDRDDDGVYSVSIDPIRYQEKKQVLDLEITSIFSKDIVDKTGNFLLSVSLEKIFSKRLKFKNLQAGDKVIAFYTQKVRNGKYYGTQVVDAAMIYTKKKKYYAFLAEDEKYYDEFGKTNYKSSFIVPCKYRRISSKFSLKRWHPILRKYRAHHGIDYAGPIGTPIHAAYDGKVIFMGRKGGYGKTIVIKHAHHYKTLYAHLSRYNLKLRGKIVKKGTIIGYLGNTGMSTGPHLHFGLSHNNTWINPESKIVFTKQLVGKKKKVYLSKVNAYKKKFNFYL